MSNAEIGSNWSLLFNELMKSLTMIKWYCWKASILLHIFRLFFIKCWPPFTTQGDTVIFKMVRLINKMLQNFINCIFTTASQHEWMAKMMESLRFHASQILIISRILGAIPSILHKKMPFPLHLFFWLPTLGPASFPWEKIN